MLTSPHAVALVEPGVQNPHLQSNCRPSCDATRSHDQHVDWTSLSIHDGCEAIHSPSLTVNGSTSLARLDVSTRVLKRAQYEAFEFELHDGTLLVRNGSHPDPENHEYEVTVSIGIPTWCECPANEAYEGACKHRVAAAIRTPVLEAALHTHLAADGSGSADHPLTEAEYLSEKDAARSPQESEESADDSSKDDTDDEEEYPCECDDLTDDFPCRNCAVQGRRSLLDP